MLKLSLRRLKFESGLTALAAYLVLLKSDPSATFTNPVKMFVDSPFARATDFDIAALRLGMSVEREAIV